MDWIPVYESLFETEKRGLLLASRGILVGLSLFARKEQRDGVVRLPLGITDAAEGIRDLLGGTLDEARAALQQLTDPEDPAIEINGKPGRLTVRVLSSATWALGGGAAVEPSALASNDPRSRRREADAERKRLARQRTKAPDMSALERGQGADASAKEHGHDADTAADASAKRPQNVRGQSADAGGVRGGVSVLETQKRKEEKREEEKQSARAHDCGHGSGHDADSRADIVADAPSDAKSDTVRTRPADVRTGRLLGALRNSPDLRAMEAQRHIDLQRCARDVVTDATNYVIGGKLRDDEIDERLDVVVTEFVREVAAAASTSQPMLPREVSKKIRTFATTTLSKSREEWRARGPRGVLRPRPGEEPRRRPSEAELAGLGLGGDQ